MINLKIKKISKQKFLIYLDDIPRGVLSASRLKEIPLSLNGKDYLEIHTNKDIIKKIEKAIDSALWQKTLNWLARQERSSYELLNYLQKNYLPADIAQKFLQKLQILYYINDERFAEMYITSLNTAGKSRKEIKNKLYQKIADFEQTEKWLQKYFNAQMQSEKISQHIQKLLLRWQKLPLPEKKHKIVNYLFRRGFPSQQIFEELNKRMTENE